jgi:hypothetical protein
MGMPTYDIIGITSHGLFWTVVEVNVALIACCLPTLRPVLSMAALRTLFASFVQSRGSVLNSRKSTHNASRHGRSSASAHTNGNRSRAVSDTGSDISLVDMVRKLGGMYVTREVHVVRDSENDVAVNEKRYIGSGVRGDAIV